MRRNICDVELHEQLIYPMVNDAARILEQGIAARASDIDFVWLYGYGWPCQKDGPTYHAG